MYDAKTVKKDVNNLRCQCIVDKGYFRNPNNTSLFNQKASVSSYTLKNF